MQDISFKTDTHMFSYRIAGIVVHDGCVLLQKPDDDTGYAYPGGQAAFGETNEETLKREFMEELGEEIEVGELKWVAEIFFPWRGKTCQQICLYYMVRFKNPSIPLSGSFYGIEEMEGRRFKLGFYWTKIEDMEKMEVYPENAGSLMKSIDSGVQHFVYVEP
ncbi:MAG: NUDIX hydrolase [Clostridia bacterium]|nr:NUDIX hydrolase [Clostridia bacterium]